MSKFFKKLFGALADKPWDKEQMIADNIHQGKTFNISLQTSAVIVIFGVSTALFSLVVTGYLYSIPVSQDTGYLLKPNLLWLNTLILLLSKKSTIPFTNGFSGPTITKSTLDCFKNFKIFSKSSISKSIFSASC